MTLMAYKIVKVVAFLSEKKYVGGVMLKEMMMVMMMIKHVNGCSLTNSPSSCTSWRKWWGGGR